MKPAEHSLCLAVPENADPSLVSAVIDSLRRRDTFRHFEVHVLELPHERGAIFNHGLTDAFVEESSHHQLLAVLTFPDGTIHSVHGLAINDRRRRKHEDHVYQISINGEVIWREIRQLSDQILSRVQTVDHVWGSDPHRMRPYH